MVVPFSHLHVVLGLVVDVDLVVSSLIHDGLEVLDVLDVHFPSRLVQCFVMVWL